MQDNSSHSQNLLECLRNAILWSCLFFIFINGIAGRSLSPENRHKPTNVPAVDDAYRQHMDRRVRIYNRHGVQVLPAIPEEREEEEELVDKEHIPLRKREIISETPS